MPSEASSEDAPQFVENTSVEEDRTVVAMASSPSVAGDVIAVEPATDGQVIPIASDNRAADTAPPKKKMRHVVWLSAGLAAAIAGVILGLGASHRDDAERIYHDSVAHISHGIERLADAVKPSIGPIGASAPVPKEPVTQTLRTTNDVQQNLLTAAEPTETNSPTAVKSEAPVAMFDPNSAALTSSLPQKRGPLAASSSALSTPLNETATAPLVPPSPASLSVPLDTAAPAALPKREVASAPAPAPQEATTAPAGRALSSADIGQLLRHGDQLLASGDIIAARHYFELVAEAGDTRASLRLGKTYDPGYLQQTGVRGVTGDAATAKSWYLKAIAAGDKEADLQLLRLMMIYPE